MISHCASFSIVSYILNISAGVKCHKKWVCIFYILWEFHILEINTGNVLVPLLCPGVAIARGYSQHGMNWQTNTTAWMTPLRMW